MSCPTQPIDVVFGTITRTTTRRIRPAYTKNYVVNNIPNNNNNSSSAEQNTSDKNSGNALLGFFWSSSSSTNKNEESNNNSQGEQNNNLDDNVNDGDGEGGNDNNNNDNSLKNTIFDPEPHIERLRVALEQETVNTVADDAPLRKLLWLGCVEQPLLRAEAWRMCLGISPATKSRRLRDAVRQVHEYRDYLELYYYQRKKTSSSSSSSINEKNSSNELSVLPHTTKTPIPPQDQRTKAERDILHQLSIDLPRHKIALYRHQDLVERLRRCLFVWSLRSPAVGYVQGMDDAVVVYFLTFLDEAFSMLEEWNKINNSNSNTEKQKKKQKKEEVGEKEKEEVVVESAETQLKQWLTLRSTLSVNKEVSPNYNLMSVRPWSTNLEKLSAAISKLPPCALDVVECDTYNCGGRFLSWGMDRYTFGQPAVLACVDTISTTVKSLDPDLFSYIRDVCGLEFRAFAYKWVHLLLVRDLGQWLSMRLFDTLLSCGSSGCWDFFSYFCVAWLLSMRNVLLSEIAFDDALSLLQEPSKAGNYPLSSFFSSSSSNINSPSNSSSSSPTNLNSNSSNNMLGVASSPSSSSLPKPFHREGKHAARWLDQLLSKTYMLMMQEKSKLISKQQQQRTMSNSSSPVTSPKSKN